MALPLLKNFIEVKTPEITAALGHLVADFGKHIMLVDEESHHEAARCTNVFSQTIVQHEITATATVSALVKRVGVFSGKTTRAQPTDAAQIRKAKPTDGRVDGTTVVVSIFW